MNIKRWFGLSKEEADILEKMFKEEISALKKLDASARSKKELVFPIESVTGMSSEARKAINDTIRLLNQEILTEQDTFRLVEVMKNREQGDNLTDKILRYIRRELEEDELWKNLRDVLNEQQSIVSQNLSQDGLSRLKESIGKELHILSTVETITKQEHSELHAHFTNTVPVPHLFGILCDLAVKRPEYLEKRIKKVEADMYPRDAKALRLIVKRIQDGDSKVKLQKELEELIEVKYEHREFAGFMKKDAILRPLWSVMTKQEGTTEALYQMGIESYNHGITYIEARYTTNVEGLRSFNAAQEKLDSENIPVKLKYIIILYMYNCDIDGFMTEVVRMKHEEPDLFRKFVVGIDYIGIHESADDEYTAEADLRRISKLGLNITTHVGEYFEGDIQRAAGLDKYKSIERVLRNVEICVDAHRYGVKRLGHASILGVNLKSYFSGEEMDEWDVQKLVDWQKRIAKKVKDFGIVIESNPTSNMRILTLETMKRHPADSMIHEHGLKVTVNTDDKAQFRTTLQKELYRLASALNLKNSELQKIIDEGKRARLANL
ncbi:hypothetical protein GOV11_01250 [Candidatus Woesearchaeota archaeon]|nr:hypothetical protein [Candidatus Woesearchaeota archaeon]